MFANEQVNLHLADRCVARGEAREGLGQDVRGGKARADRLKRELLELLQAELYV
jgi:hypothetical protein